MTWEWLDRSRIWFPCGWNGWKTLIVTNQHHFLITYTRSALNVNVNRTKTLSIKKEKCSGHEFLLEQLQIYQGGKNLTQKRLRGPSIWKDMLKTALSHIANWRTKRQSSYTKSQVHAWMITISRMKSLHQLENYQKYARRLSWNAHIWHELVHLTFHGQWTNLFYQSPKWTGACDKRSARLISYIHHTRNYRPYCHVGSTSQHCRLGLFQDSNFASDLEDSKSTSCGSLYEPLQAEHLSPSVGCVRNKRQYPTVLQNLKIISLDAGLRMDGLLALDLWDVVLEVVRSSKSTKTPTNTAAGNCSRNHKSKPKQKEIRDVDPTSPPAQILLKASASCTSLKTMKLSSRLSKDEVQQWETCHEPTELLLIFDRVNLDPKNQIKHVESINQPADMLTKSNSTRDEWDHLLRLWNIMNFSKSVMSKRAQEGTSKEGSAVAVLRPMNLVSRNLLSAKKTTLQDSSASNSPENQEFDQSCVSSSGGKLTRNINQDPTMYSQERQQDDTESSSSSKLGRRDKSSNSARSRKQERGEDIQTGRSKMDFHKIQISDHRYLERVFKNQRENWISQKRHE